MFTDSGTDMPEEKNQINLYVIHVNDPTSKAIPDGILMNPILFWAGKACSSHVSISSLYLDAGQSKQDPPVHGVSDHMERKTSP